LPTKKSAAPAMLHRRPQFDGSRIFRLETR
jgi:hypothetical protein